MFATNSDSFYNLLLSKRETTTQRETMSIDWSKLSKSQIDLTKLTISEKILEDIQVTKNYNIIKSQHALPTYSQMINIYTLQNKYFSLYNDYIMTNQFKELLVFNFDKDDYDDWTDITDIQTMQQLNSNIKTYAQIEVSALVRNYDNNFVADVTILNTVLANNLKAVPCHWRLTIDYTGRILNSQQFIF